MTMIIVERVFEALAKNREAWAVALDNSEVFDKPSSHVERLYCSWVDF